MKLNERLFQIFETKARKTKIKTISLGLGYTAAQTDDGGLGIAYTYFENKTSCSPNANYIDFETVPAIDLLHEIRSEDTIRRSMALALVNALNYEYAKKLPEDTKDGAYFSKFDIKRGTKIAMVGHFKPIAKICESVGAEVEIIDYHKEVGNTERFEAKLKDWAEVLIVTSTSILNNTTEAVLSKAGNGVKTVLMGPSSPMVPEAFEGMNVHMIAGSVPIDHEGVLKAVRHGTGTPIIGKRCKKAYVEVLT